MLLASSEVLVSVCFALKRKSITASVAERGVQEKKGVNKEGSTGLNSNNKSLKSERNSEYVQTLHAS